MLIIRFRKLFDLPFLTSSMTDVDSVKRAFDEAATLGGLWGPVEVKCKKSPCTLL